MQFYFLIALGLAGTELISSSQLLRCRVLGEQSSVDNALIFQLFLNSVGTASRPSLFFTLPAVWSPTMTEGDTRYWEAYSQVGDPNKLRRYSMPYNVMLSIILEGSGI